MEPAFDGVENILGKEENAGYLFPANVFERNLCQAITT